MSKSLDPIIKINDEYYAINAKLAENALRVKTDLTIALIDSKDLTYNGSNPVNTPKLMTEKGGTINGPIKANTVTAKTITSTGTHQSFSATDVLNFKEVNNLINNNVANGIKGLQASSIVYKWEPNGDNNFEENEFGPCFVSSEGGDANAIAGIGLVCGEEEKSGFGKYFDLTATPPTPEDPNEYFSYMNMAEEWLPAYLYICSDTGNIYFGTYESTDLLSLGKTSQELAGNDKGNIIKFTAKDIQDIKELLNDTITKLKNGNFTVEKAKLLVSNTTKYSADDIASNLTSLDTKIDGVGRALTNNVDGINTRVANLENVLSTDGILSTTTTVKQALKATNDSAGRNIVNNYYRSANNTTASNSIYVSESTAQAPSAPQKYDIWIKY